MFSAVERCFKKCNAVRAFGWEKEKRKSDWLFDGDGGLLVMKTITMGSLVNRASLGTISGRSSLDSDLRRNVSLGSSYLRFQSCNYDESKYY